MTAAQISPVSPPPVVGFANGIAQSIVSLARFLGPIFGGYVRNRIIGTLICLSSSCHSSGPLASMETLMDTRWALSWYQASALPLSRTASLYAKVIAHACALVQFAIQDNSTIDTHQC
jgi:hypothetical protein